MSHDAARSDILGAIRENLAASAPHDAWVTTGAHQTTSHFPLPVLPVAPAPTPAPASNPTDRFKARLEAVGGQCVVVHGEAEAGEALGAILATSGARRVVVSDAPLVRRLLPAGGGFTVESVDDLSRADLFACDAGVTAAQWGIAESGTLVLESAREKHRVVSLVPPVHVAILPVSSLCETLAEALARVRDPDGSGTVASRAITLITGPSRSADIELTLVVGVHGPQALHVILVEDSVNPDESVAAKEGA